MCYLTYTNFQRQGAVANMTAGEVMDAEKCREYRVIQVWEHKTVMTHSSARLACHIRVYQLLMEYLEKTQEGCRFTQLEKVTHITVELVNILASQSHSQ